MKTIANIIWIIFGGILLALGWFLTGILLCLTIIGIPFGKQCFKIAGFVLAPMGKSVSIHFDKHPIMNIIWLLLFGWELAIAFLGAGILMFVFIITIPFGVQCFKMVPLALMPFGANVSR